MSEPFSAHLGSWGVTTCTLENPTGLCGAPATKHLLVRVKTGMAGALNVCDQCFIYLIQARVHISDNHTFGDHCNLPHSEWIPSDANGPGTCRLPDGVTDELERFANQPIGASV